MNAAEPVLYDTSYQIFHAQLDIWLILYKAISGYLTNKTRVDQLLLIDVL